MSQNSRTAPRLSVIIIAGHEERNIAACLDSVAWADEIVVVHSSYEDRTHEIASGYTDRVVFNSFEGYAAQKHFALSQATGDWVLSIDADERVTTELRDEIRSTLAAEERFTSYSMPRKNYIHGTWLRHGGWYPDRQVRLFRRDLAALTERLVHESFVVEGEQGELRSPLLHYTVPSIQHMLRKNLEYSRYEAIEKAPRRRVGAMDFIFRPPIEFFVKYIIRLGILDGWEGLIVAVVHTLNKVQVLLRIWEIQRRPDLEIVPRPREDGKKSPIAAE